VRLHRTRQPGAAHISTCRDRGRREKSLRQRHLGVPWFH
jgi:hypothetical protein